MKEKKGLVGIPFDSIILLFMPYILYIHVMCFSKLREHKFDEEKKNGEDKNIKHKTQRIFLYIRISPVHMRHTVYEKAIKGSLMHY